MIFFICVVASISFFCLFFGLHTDRISIPLGFLQPVDLLLHFSRALLWAEAFPKPFALTIGAGTSLLRWRVSFSRVLIFHLFSNRSFQMPSASRHLVGVLCWWLGVLGLLRTLGSFRVPYHFRDGISGVGGVCDATLILIIQFWQIAFAFRIGPVCFFVRSSGLFLSLICNMCEGPGFNFTLGFIHIFPSFRGGLCSSNSSDQVNFDFSSYGFQFLPDSFAFFYKISLGRIWGLAY